MQNKKTYNEKTARNKRIAEKFKNGQTLSSIGKEYGISRQAVQIIISRSKLDRSNGGYFGSKARIKERAEIKKEKQRNHIKKINDKYGMNYKDVRELQTTLCDTTCPTLTNPTYVFFRKKHNAIRAGINWTLKFGDWWKLWSESGKWEERGRKNHEYVLGRKTNKRGFTPENSVIITNKENIANRIYKER